MDSFAGSYLVNSSHMFCYVAIQTNTQIPQPASWANNIIFLKSCEKYHFIGNNKGLLNTGHFFKLLWWTRNTADYDDCLSAHQLQASLHHHKVLSAHSHPRPTGWECIRLASLSVCLSVYHLHSHLFLCLVFKSPSPWLSFFSFDSASLSVLVHLSLTFFHLPSLCFLPIRLPRCLYVCLSACISACPCIQSVCLPPPCLPYLSCLCSSTRRHNTHPIMI